MLVWDRSEDNKDDFQEKISDKDLCLTLYYDTFDASTQTELETAYQSLCEGKNPKKIYVYFKDGETVPEELQSFRDSFPTKYGHFYCSFSNIDTLKADFLLQFMEYQSKNPGSDKILEVTNGKVTIDGREYVDLKNVPFAGSNEEYNLLLRSINKTQKLLAITEVDDPEYADYAAELQEMKEKLSKMETNLWDTALMITRLSTTKCSERLKRAMDLFSTGDNKRAQAVLNEEEIEHDVEHNLHLMQLGEEGKNGLKINIDEYRLKIKTLENEMSDGWLEQILAVQERILKLTISLYGERSEETALEINMIGLVNNTKGDYKHALGYGLKALELRRELLGERHPDTATSYNNVGAEYISLGMYSEGISYREKALAIANEIKDERLAARISNRIARSYLAAGNHSKAKEFFLKASDAFKKNEMDEEYASNLEEIEKISE